MFVLLAAGAPHIRAASSLNQKRHQLPLVDIFDCPIYLLFPIQLMNRIQVSISYSLKYFWDSTQIQAYQVRLLRLLEQLHQPTHKSQINSSTGI